MFENVLLDIIGFYQRTCQRQFLAGMAAENFLKSRPEVVIHPSVDNWIHKRIAGSEQKEELKHFNCYGRIGCWATLLLQIKKEADYEGKPANEKAPDHHANHLWRTQINREIYFVQLI